MKENIIQYWLLMILVCPIALRASNYVILNQIMYDSPLNEQVSDSPYSNGEFIELYNGSDEAVSLQGWYMTGNGVTEQYSFPNVSIASKGYLIVAFQHEDSPTFALSSLFDQLINYPNLQVIYQNNIVLSNGGETITLHNANHEIVDQIYYDGTSHVTKPDRLCASNEGVSSGNQCVSLHRTWVEFDEEGKVVLGTSQWKTDMVSFGTCQLTETTFGEHYLTSSSTSQMGDNYILSITPLDPTTRVSITDNGISVSNGVRTQTTLQYYDGLGRPVETTALGVTPGKYDLVQITEYSGLHRAIQQWSPVPAQTDGQLINVSDIKSQTQSFYSNNRPFVETLYENSALERVIGHRRQGSAWSAHPSSCADEFNEESDSVRIYVVMDGYLQTPGYYYAPNSLHKTVVTDEDGISVITYTDKVERKIMEERDGHHTYYVYDDLGYLRFVLPHIPSSKLNHGGYALTDSTLKAAAYCYKYDSVGNMVYKRLPGCEPQYMVYDKTGHLILKQDGNQRAKNEWTLYTYDSIGRKLYTAELQSSQTHEYYLSYFANRWYVEHYGNNPSNTSIPGTGYASSIFNKSDLQLLTVNYYDDYDYLSRLSTPMRQAIRFSQELGYGLQHENATGMLTGTRIYNLFDKEYTAVSYYYDTQGRIVQQRSARSADGYRTSISTEYFFDGSVAQQLSEQGTDNNIIREHYKYTYDHAGRAKSVRYQLNNNAEITLSSFSYDSIGRLAQNLLHNHQDTIRYAYDIRDMLTETNNKHFSERLFYADSLFDNVPFALPCYNGNIAAAVFKQTDSVYAFSYEYDAMNRFAESKYKFQGQLSTCEWFQYDARGNITRLQRYSGPRQLDDLTFTYQQDGNQLLAIYDNGVDGDLYGMIDYEDSHHYEDSIDMRYDANGNLIFDADRGISAIHYNILNLPDTIQFAYGGHQIVNLYDAAGHKQKSIIYTNLEPGMSYYPDVAHYTFEMDSVYYHVTDYDSNIETYYTPLDTTRRIFNNIGYFDSKTNVHYHYIKNHLGNICAVVNSTADTLVQSTIYYANGVPMGETKGIPYYLYMACGVQPNQNFGRDEQPYLYNGKEFIEAHGLNEYDSQARYYYATIMRTNSMDPLAEKYYHISPYAWCANDPMNMFDSNGCTIWKLDEKGNLEHKQDDETQDALIMNGNKIAFEFGSIKDVVQEESGQTTFTFVDANVAAEAFKFMADNSEVEYAFLPAETEDSKFITQHVYGQANVALNLFEDAPSIFAFIHNHPNNTQPSGFIGEKAYGDREAAQLLVSKLKREIPQYIYRPMYYCQLTPYDTDFIYSNVNWDELFSSSGKILTSSLYLQPTVKYLTTTVPTYPTIHIR